MHKKVALFAPIEADLNNINSKELSYTRYYEMEAIKCFSCWRENGGWLSEIPIFAICPTKNTISEQTKSAFKKLNVNYLEVYIEETESYECGFWNIPLVGKWAEENLSYEYLIKIDLDLYLIKELPHLLFEILESEKDIVGVHDIEAHSYLKTLNHFKYATFYNTGLTITKRDRRFFEKQYLYLFKMLSEFNQDIDKFTEKYDLKVCKKIDDQSGIKSFEYQLLEELCVSVMVNELGVQIYGLENYCLETMEFELGKDNQFDLAKVYFIHEHLDNSDTKEKILTRIRYASLFGEKHGYRYFFEYK